MLGFEALPRVQRRGGPASCALIIHCIRMRPDRMRPDRIGSEDGNDMDDGTVVHLRTVVLAEDGGVMDDRSVVQLRTVVLADDGLMTPQHVPVTVRVGHFHGRPWTAGTVSSLGRLSIRHVRCRTP